MQSHYITASRHCITPSHYTTALRHRITPLRHNTRSTRSTAYTVGRRYKPISFPNSSARHPWATLCLFFVAGESALIPSRISSETPSAPLGDITASKCSPTEPCDILGRHYCPKTFPNRAVRYPWATLKPRNVPQQFCAAPSGDVTAPKRSPTGPCDTLGQHYSPKTFPNSSARHPRATLCLFFVAGEFALKPS